MKVAVYSLLFLFVPSATFASGAIAVDANWSKKGPPVYAIVIGYDSVEEASRAAFRKCMTNGGSRCGVVANFDKCGAFAYSATSSGTGWGLTGRIARNMALRNCGDNHIAVASECEP